MDVSTSLHRPAGTWRGSAILWHFFLCLAARVCPPGSWSWQPLWWSRGEGQVPLGPQHSAWPSTSPSRDLGDTRAWQPWRIWSAISFQKFVRLTWSEGCCPAPGLTWVLSQPLDSNRNCRATSGCSRLAQVRREAILPLAPAKGRRLAAKVRGPRDERWQSWGIPGPLPGSASPACPGPQPRRERGRLNRAPPAVFIFHKRTLPQGGEAKFVSSAALGSPRAEPRGSREPPQGDGAAAMPSSLALQAPSLSTEGPGATLAGPSRGSCPVLTAPHPLLGQQGQRLPSLLWPRGPVWAGGAGEDGRCPCSLRATRFRPPFQVGPLSWPHWPRAACSGVGGWVYRGPSAPRAQEPGPWVYCRNSVGPLPRDSAMSRQGLLRDGRLTPLPG